ncbi:Neuronal acetylcholine receptor subunit alpha-9 [Holothuria leucospilota]|uniref:Neuronal acetylcholine receptor subunit alpha-9 n=1 Tax=Holothuria leucospilota TaxID=206669 RepID=A0A9Q1BTP3_HOLLE|nr:Neuronal acetylcholine receptor subunit alpha-9 [Holothuria leucospilota]
MYTDEIWTPKIALSVTLQSYGVDIAPHHGLINLQSDGTATLGTPIVQTTQCPVIVISFPFDTQVCAFFFSPENQPGRKVSLFAKTPTEAEKSVLESSEWKFTNLSVQNFTYLHANLVDNQVINVTAAVFCIVLERYPDYYVKTLVIPSTLMCTMSFVTFLVHPDSGERMSVGVSLVLGLTVFQILVAEILPEASDQSPILNRYLIVTFIIACLAVPVSLINLNIAWGDSSIPILKRDSLRKVFLEFLPKLCLVSTYSERIRQMTTMHVARSNPACYADETGTHRTDSLDTQTAIQSDQTQGTQSTNEIEPAKTSKITITYAEKVT